MYVVESGDDARAAPALVRTTWVTAALAAAAFVLGVVGYLEAGGVSVATAVYNTLSLFTLSFAMPPHISESALPVTLELARFLAPAATVLAAATIAARVFRDQFDRVRARHSRGHVVVCGLGRVGSIIASRLHAAGYRVLAIERDPNCVNIRSARSLGIPVVVGDARTRRILDRASAANAVRLVWSAGEWVEGQAVVDSLVDNLRENRAQLARRRGDRSRAVETSSAVPACLVRVRDLALCTSLRRRVLVQDRDAPGVGPDVDFFNEAENVAQRLLWKATRSFAGVGDGSVDLWILGSGALAEGLIVQAARNWWGLPESRTRPALAIHVFSEDAADLIARIDASWPEVAGACRLEAHGGPPEVATSRDITARPKVEPHVAFVLVEAQERAVQIGLRLLDETSIPRVAVAGDPDFQARVVATRLELFDPLRYGLESGVLLFDTYELFARMFHEHYTLHARVRGDGSLEPASDDPLDPKHEWNALDELWRASNRDAARFVVPNLRAAGFGVERLSASGDSPQVVRLDPLTIEAMAEREHERWRRFMTAHGFRHGSKRDLTLRTNPDLLPWAEASEGARDYTRTTVAEYTRLLAQLGYQVHAGGGTAEGRAS